MLCVSVSGWLPAFSLDKAMPLVPGIWHHCPFSQRGLSPPGARRAWLTVSLPCDLGPGSHSDLFLLLVCHLSAFKVDHVIFLILLPPFRCSLGLPKCAGVSHSLEAAVWGSLLTTSGHSLCFEKRNGSPFSIWAGHCVPFVTLGFLFQEDLLFYCRTIFHKGPSVL